MRGALPLGFSLGFMPLGLCAGILHAIGCLYLEEVLERKPISFLVNHAHLCEEERAFLVAIVVQIDQHRRRAQPFGGACPALDLGYNKKA